MAICFTLKEPVFLILVIVITSVLSGDLMQLLEILKEDAQNSDESNKFIRTVLEHKNDLEWIENLGQQYRGIRDTLKSHEDLVNCNLNSPNTDQQHRRIQERNNNYKYEFRQNNNNRYSPYVFSPYSSLDDSARDKRQSLRYEHRPQIRVIDNGLTGALRTYNLKHVPYKRKTHTINDAEEQKVINIDHEKEFEQLESEPREEYHDILGLRDYSQKEEIMEENKEYLKTSTEFSEIQHKNKRYGNSFDRSENILFPKWTRMLKKSTDYFNTNPECDDGKCANINNNNKMEIRHSDTPEINIGNAKSNIVNKEIVEEVFDPECTSCSTDNTNQFEVMVLPESITTRAHEIKPTVSPKLSSISVPIILPVIMKSPITTDVESYQKRDTGKIIQKKEVTTNHSNVTQVPFVTNPPVDIIHSRNYHNFVPEKDIYIDANKFDANTEKNLFKDILDTEKYVPEYGPLHIARIQPATAEPAHIISFEHSSQKTIEGKAVLNEMTDEEKQKAAEEAHKLMEVDKEFNERNEPELDTKSDVDIPDRKDNKESNTQYTDINFKSRSLKYIDMDKDEQQYIPYMNYDENYRYVNRHTKRSNAKEVIQNGLKKLKKIFGFGNDKSEYEEVNDAYPFDEEQSNILSEDFNDYDYVPRHKDKTVHRKYHRKGNSDHKNVKFYDSPRVTHQNKKHFTDTRKRYKVDECEDNTSKTTASSTTTCITPSTTTTTTSTTPPTTTTTTTTTTTPSTTTTTQTTTTSCKPPSTTTSSSRICSTTATNKMEVIDEGDDDYLADDYEQEMCTETTTEHMHFGPTANASLEGTSNKKNEETQIKNNEDSMNVTCAINSSTASASISNIAVVTTENLAITTVSEITSPTTPEISSTTLSEATINIVSETTETTVSEASLTTVSEAAETTISETVSTTVSEATESTFSEAVITTISEAADTTRLEVAPTTASEAVETTVSEVVSTTISETAKTTDSEVAPTTVSEATETKVLEVVPTTFSETAETTFSEVAPTIVSETGETTFFEVAPTIVSETGETTISEISTVAISEITTTISEVTTTNPETTIVSKEVTTSHEFTTSHELTSAHTTSNGMSTEHTHVGETTTHKTPTTHGNGKHIIADKEHENKSKPVVEDFSDELTMDKKLHEKTTEVSHTTSHKEGVHETTESEEDVTECTETSDDTKRKRKKSLPETAGTKRNIHNLGKFNKNHSKRNNHNIHFKRRELNRSHPPISRKYEKSNTSYRKFINRHSKRALNSMSKPNIDENEDTDDGKLKTIPVLQKYNNNEDDDMTLQNRKNTQQNGKLESKRTNNKANKYGPSKFSLNRYIPRNIRHQFEHYNNHPKIRTRRSNHMPSVNKYSNSQNNIISEEATQDDDDDDLNYFAPVEFESKHFKNPFAAREQLNENINYKEIKNGVSENKNKRSVEGRSAHLSKRNYDANFRKISTENMKKRNRMDVNNKEKNEHITNARDTSHNDGLIDKHLKDEALKGQLAAQIVESIFNEVESSGQLQRHIGPGLKKNHTTKPFSNRGKSDGHQKEEEQKQLENMQHDIMKSLNKLIEEEMQRKTCESLDPHSAVFLEQLTSRQNNLAKSYETELDMKATDRPPHQESFLFEEPKKAKSNNTHHDTTAVPHVQTSPGDHNKPTTHNGHVNESQASHGHQNVTTQHGVTTENATKLTTVEHNTEHNTEHSSLPVHTTQEITTHSTTLHGPISEDEYVEENESTTCNEDAEKDIFASEHVPTFQTVTGETPHLVSTDHEHSTEHQQVTEHEQTTEHEQLTEHQQSTEHEHSMEHQQKTEQEHLTEQQHLTEHQQSTESSKTNTDTKEMEEKKEKVKRLMKMYNNLPQNDRHKFCSVYQYLHKQNIFLDRVIREIKKSTRSTRYSQEYLERRPYRNQFYDYPRNLYVPRYYRQHLKPRHQIWSQQYVSKDQQTPSDKYTKLVKRAMYYRRKREAEERLKKQIQTNTSRKMKKLEELFKVTTVGREDLIFNYSNV